MSEHRVVISFDDEDVAGAFCADLSDGGLCGALQHLEIYLEEERGFGISIDFGDCFSAKRDEGSDRHIFIRNRKRAAKAGDES